MSARPKSARVTCWLASPYRKKNGTLVYRFRYHKRQGDGTLKPVQESVPQEVAWNRRHRGQALRYMLRRQDELNSGGGRVAIPDGEAVGDVTLREAVERYMTDMRPRWRRRTWYEKGLLLGRLDEKTGRWGGRFLDFAGPRTPVAEITGGTVSAYLQTRLAAGVRATTFNKDLRDLRAFFKALVDVYEYLPRNPCRAVQDLDAAEVDAEPVARPVLSDAQAAAVVRNALALADAPAEEGKPPRWRIDALALWTLAETGMRLTELLTRRWDHLRRLPAESDRDLARTVIVLPGREVKGKRDRVTPVLSEDLSTELDAYRTGLNLEGRQTGYAFRPWRVLAHEARQWGVDYSRKRLRDFLRVACESAGVPVITPHALRRTFATTLETLGVGSEIVQATGGWASRRVVAEHYVDAEVLNARAVQAAREVAEARDFGRLVTADADDGRGST